MRGKILLIIGLMTVTMIFAFAIGLISIPTIGPSQLGQSTGYPAGFTKYSNHSCTSRNEIGAFKGKTITECANACRNTPSCRSFEIGKNKDAGKCNLSTSCIPSASFYHSNSGDWDIYVKN